MNRAGEKDRYLGIDTSTDMALLFVTEKELSLHFCAQRVRMSSLFYPHLSM